MDRKDALGYYLIFIAGSWIAFPTYLILTQNYAADYGHQVLVDTTFIAILLVGVGILIYRWWPPSPQQKLKPTKYEASAGELKAEGHGGTFKFGTLNNEGYSALESEGDVDVTAKDLSAKIDGGPTRHVSGHDGPKGKKSRIWKRVWSKLLTVFGNVHG